MMIGCVKSELDVENTQIMHLPEVHMSSNSIAKHAVKVANGTMGCGADSLAGLAGLPCLAGLADLDGLAGLAWLAWLAWLAQATRRAQK